MDSSSDVRLMALVRTDIVDSTPLTLRLGDDAASPVLQRHLRSLRSVVDAYQGRIVKSLGDGLLAAFESASTAVRASREMQASIDRDNRRNRDAAPLHIRVGVSVGDVTWIDGEIDGRPAIEVERLQSVARPDQILCSRQVVDLTGGRFDDAVRSLGSRSLKGYTHEIEVFEVSWSHADRHVAELSPALRHEPRTAFVARDAQLASVLGRWQHAAAGRAGTVVVAGEAGVGKSRLVREVALRAHQEGATVLYGRCSPDRDRPYEPFAEAIDQFVAQERGQRHRLGARAGDLAPLLPGLVRHEPLSAAGRAPAGEPDRIGAPAEEATLREAVWAWLVELAADEPVLFVVDDIHWADAPTLSLLQHVVSTAGQERVLMLLTMRTPLRPDLDTDLGTLRRAWRRSPIIDEIELGGLSADGARTLVEAIAGYPLDEARERAFAHRVWSHTGGNPLFIESVLGHLVAHGVLYEEAGRWSTGGALGEMDVPEAVQDVVVGQLAALPPEDRSVLQVAALLSSAIDLDLLSATTGQLGLDAGPVVDRAHESGLLVDTEATPGCYRFAHEIVRAAVASSVPASRRVELHRLIARTMEERYTPLTERQADELSHQLSFSPSAPERARAAGYAETAAEQAWARRARVTAATFYLRCAELHASTGDVAGQCDALVNAGRAARNPGDPAARETLLAAVRLAETLGDGERMARAALACSRGMFNSLGRVDVDLVDALERALVLLPAEDSALRASALAVIGVELAYSQDHARRRDAAAEAVAMARRLGDPVCLASVLNLYASTLWRPDVLGERLDLASELERITAGLGRPQWRFTAASFGFQAAMESGAFLLADERLLRMESAARQLDHPGALSYLRVRQSVRRAVAGDLAEAERLATDAAQRGREAGYQDAELFYWAGMWMIGYHAGRLAEVRPAFEVGVAARPNHTVLRAALAALYGETGETSLCAGLVEGLTADDFVTVDQDLLVTGAVATMAARAVDDVRLARILRELLGPYGGQLVDNGSVHFGSVEHFLAVLAGILGDEAEAGERFERAAEDHTRLREWPMLARTWLEHGRLLAGGSGGHAAIDRSRALLREARALAAKHGCAGTVAAVDQDLDRLPAL